MSGEELQQHLKEIGDEVDKIVTGQTSESSTTSAAATNATCGDDVPSSSELLLSTKEVDVKTLSDGDLIKFLALKDYEKKKERWERYQAKSKMLDAPKDHKFWNTQPVPSLSEEIGSDQNCPIDAEVDVSKVRQEPYNMPAGFEWCSIDVNDSVQVEELYNLLNQNYVEDDEAMFRFDYSKEFLRWALTVPGYLKEWHVGVRSSKTGSLMGCITAIPVHCRVYDRVVPMAEINFLCVHKKLRTKRLAPVLIKEITRRVNLTDRWQAVYTAGVVLPKPVARCRYYHRSLNPKKLIEVRFSSLPPQTTLTNHLKTLKLPKRPSSASRGLRAMRAEDSVKVHALLANYLHAKGKLAQEFSVEEVEHVFVPRANVISTYVVENDAGEITDMCSFYYLPSTVINNPLHNKLNAVYSYYNVATTMSTEELMRDLLILARDEGADVFNALNLLENEQVFDNLLFGAGDGFLQYYLYNWKCPSMQAKDIGLVLL
jgi:glycylpeptide N-tetradecanoyltransferase